MKKMVKRIVCMALAAAVITINCSNAIAADKSASYSDLMTSEKAGAEADDNVDVEAEVIFGADKASTEIDSNSKKTDKSDSEKASSSGTKASSKSTKPDNTPKTGIEETPLYMPVLLMLAAVAAMIMAGVNIVGRKRRIG